MDAAFQPKQATGVGLDWKNGVGCGWLRRIGLHKGSFFNWITSYRRVHTRMPTFFPIDLLAGPPSATLGRPCPPQRTSNVLPVDDDDEENAVGMPASRCSSTDTDVLRAKLLAAFDTGGVLWRRDKKKEGGREGGGGRGSFFRGTYWNEITAYQTTRLYFQFLILLMGKTVDNIYIGNIYILFNSER